MAILFFTSSSAVAATEKTAHVSEGLHGPEPIRAYHYVRVSMRLAGSKLMNDLGFLSVDDETKVLTCCREVFHYLLHIRFIRAQSSAYRSSRLLSVFTFVVAFIRLMLKRPPSVLLFSFKPPCFPSKASISVAFSIMLKRVGAETHPCFNPFETGITSDLSPLCTIPTFIPSWKWPIIEMNLSRPQNVFMTAHRAP